MFKKTQFFVFSLLLAALTFYLCSYSYIQLNLVNSSQHPLKIQLFEKNKNQFTEKMSHEWNLIPEISYEIRKPIRLNSANEFRIYFLRNNIKANIHILEIEQCNFLNFCVKRELKDFQGSNNVNFSSVDRGKFSITNDSIENSYASINLKPVNIFYLISPILFIFSLASICYIFFKTAKIKYLQIIKKTFKASIINNRKFFLPIALFSFIFISRIFFLYTPTLEFDESYYGIIAQGFLRLILPYQYIFDHKPIFLDYLWTAVLFIFGSNSIFSIRIVSIIFISLGAFFVYRITFLSFKDRFKSLIGAFIFILLNFNFDGFASNSELIVNSFILGSIFFYLKYVYSNYEDTKFLALSLVFEVFALLTNFISAPIIFPLFFLQFFTLVLKKKFREIFFNLIICSAITFLLYLPLLISSDIFSYLKIQFNFLLTYQSDGANFRNNIKNLFSISYKYLILMLPLIFYFILNMQLLKKNKFIFASIISLAFSLLAVYISKRFYSHYSLLLIPSISLFLIYSILSIKNYELRKYISLCVLFLFLNNIFYPSFKGIKNAYPSIKNALIYNDTDPIFSIAKYLARNTKDSDFIYVYDNHHLIYYLSNRRPATIFAGNTMTDNERWLNLIGSSPTLEMSKIFSNKPLYIVKGENYWLTLKNTPQDIIFKNHLISDYSYLFSYAGTEIYKLKCLID